MSERPADLLHQTWLMTWEARVPIVLSSAQIASASCNQSASVGLERATRGCEWEPIISEKADSNILPKTFFF